MKLDVILVPDFEGTSRLKFEYTTNLFLASWLEHKSELSNSQLHLVSVGQPPTSTTRIAERAKAIVTVCASASGADRYRNKLNGLEVRPTSSHFVLMDTDVVLFRSIDQFSSRLDSGTISVGYAGGAQLSLAQWTIVYSRLGLTLPRQRVPMLRAAFGRQFHDSLFFDELSATLPYFNAGVVVAPWDSGLAKIWRGLIDKVPQILQSDNRVQTPIHSYALLDQPPLAIAADMLQRQGIGTRILPDALHSRWLHFCLGLTTVDDVFLAHANGIFRDNAPTGLRSGISEYSLRLRNVMRDRNASQRQEERLSTYSDFLEAYLTKLYKKWIAPVSLA